jgi:hypothetical protein
VKPGTTINTWTSSLAESPKYVHVKLWTLSRKVNPNVFLDKETKTTRTTKKISKHRNKYIARTKYCINWLAALCRIHLSPIYTTWLLSLYNSLNRLLSPYNLTCDLHGLYLMIFIYFELLTWSYSDSSSTWSPPQLGFLLNRIPHPWTFLGSDLIYPSHDSTLNGLKVLIPLWTWTPLQFGHVSSIFFLTLLGQLTRVIFTLSTYPIDLPKSCPDSLPDPHTNALSEPYPIASMFIQSYMFIPGRIILPDSSRDRTSTYPALHGLTWPNYLTRPFPCRTSAYPIIPATLPDSLTRSGYPLMHIPSSCPPPCNILWCNNGPSKPSSLPSTDAWLCPHCFKVGSGEKLGTDPRIGQTTSYWLCR